uniref:helix-turn-helix domain-containing protein n=2 Tax=unclassified Corynebacterium TaxID=2624378 RepID=UPI00178C7DD7
MGFVEMGIVLNHVELQPAQKMILMALADRADASGVCWPSITEIAHRTCQSERTVMRHIAALKSGGMVSSQQRRYRTANGVTRQASNVYHLDLAGMMAGLYDSRPKQKNSRSAPGCQSDTLESGVDVKPQVSPGCQSDSLEIPGCQSVHFQGDNGVTRRTCHKELTIPVPVPADGLRDEHAEEADGQGAGAG